MADIKEVQARVETNMQALMGIAAQEALVQGYDKEARRLHNRLHRDIKRVNLYLRKENKKTRRRHAKERRRRAYEAKPKPSPIALWWRKLWR